MCADGHERVLLPWPDKNELPGELNLAEYVVLQNDPEFKGKFDLYFRKDKLRDLLEEYIRKKGTEYFGSQMQKASFWVKYEKGEAIIDNLDSAFEVLKDLYRRFIGFNEEADVSETNANLIIDAEVF